MIAQALPCRLDGTAGARRRMTLEARVTARKAELIAEIVEHKKNSCRFGAAEAVDRLKARLSELAHIVKEDAGGGWTNVGPRAKTRLDEWMSK
jgi:hypothetical protein